MQQTIYMLGNEKGKARMTKNAEERPLKTWRTLILSTGEQKIEKMIEKGGERAFTGTLVRGIDIERLKIKVDREQAKRYVQVKFK